MSTASVLRLPVDMCRDVSLLGGSALSLKLALMLLGAESVDAPEAAPVAAPDDEDGHEFEVQDDEPVAYSPADEAVLPMRRVTMADVVAATGAAPGNVRRAFEVVRAMAASWPDEADEDGAYVTVPVFGDVGSGPRAAWGQAAVYATVTPAVAERMGAGREVEVPVADLLALRTRAGVLMLVRGLAALSIYGGLDTVRTATGSAELGLYTGVATGAPTSPWDQLSDHVVPGAAELERRVASVRARVLVDRVHVYDHRPPTRDRAEPRRQRRAAVGQVDVVWTRRVPRGTAALPEGVDVDAV